MQYWIKTRILKSFTNEKDRWPFILFKQLLTFLCYYKGSQMHDERLVSMLKFDFIGWKLFYFTSIFYIQWLICTLLWRLIIVFNVTYNLGTYNLTLNAHLNASSFVCFLKHLKYMYTWKGSSLFIFNVKFSMSFSLRSTICRTFLWNVFDGL